MSTIQFTHLPPATAYSVATPAATFSSNYSALPNQGGVIALNGPSADITVNGKSLMDSLDEINKRLNILVPDPARIAEYESLKNAYDHYKTLEAILYGN